MVNLEQFVTPARQIKNIGWLGLRMCPHCTAAGKVLLVYLPGNEIDQIPPAHLERLTPHTLTDRQAVGRELSQMHDQGCAVAWERLEEGWNVIASTVSPVGGSDNAWCQASQIPFLHL